MKSGNLSKMLEYVGMKFEGREHCGLDDTRNITRVVIQMINDGCILKYNRFIPEDALNYFALNDFALRVGYQVVFSIMLQVKVLLIPE